MALRTGHGKGAGVPRIEVLPASELPEGLAALEREATPEVERDATGRLQSSEAARKLGAKGGAAKRAKTRLAAQLGLADMSKQGEFRRYRAAADAFHRHKVRELAQTVGGGVCGSGPAAIVATAALQRAASAYLFDLAGISGDPELFVQASRLGNDSRQNLLAAHELCAKEAKSRPSHADTPWIVREGSKP